MFILFQMAMFAMIGLGLYGAHYKKRHLELSKPSKWFWILTAWLGVVLLVTVGMIVAGVFDMLMPNA